MSVSVRAMVIAAVSSVIFSGCSDREDENGEGLSPRGNAGVSVNHIDCNDCLLGISLGEYPEMGELLAWAYGMQSVKEPSSNKGCGLVCSYRGLQGVVTAESPSADDIFDRVVDLGASDVSGVQYQSVARIEDATVYEVIVNAAGSRHFDYGSVGEINNIICSHARSLQPEDETAAMLVVNAAVQLGLAAHIRQSIEGEAYPLLYPMALGGAAQSLNVAGEISMQIPQDILDEVVLIVDEEFQEYRRQR